MFVASARLSSFEQAVSSIVRIEVPAGVLADVYEPDLTPPLTTTGLPEGRPLVTTKTRPTGRSRPAISC